MLESVNPVQHEQTTHSEKIEALFAAIAKAQGSIRPPKKDSVNPFHNSTYADLASDWEACRGPLTENGLSVIQTTHVNGERMVLRTWLCHSSGQWISGDYLLTPQKNDPQGMKSCVTYARRAALEAIVGLAPEDDDGNAASSPRQPSPPRQESRPSQAPQGQSDRPSQADYAKANPNWENELATEAQRKRLWAMSKAAGYDEAPLKDMVKLISGKESTKELTKGEIQKLFQELEIVLRGTK